MLFYSICWRLKQREEWQRAARKGITYGSRSYSTFSCVLSSHSLSLFSYPVQVSRSRKARMLAMERESKLKAKKSESEEISDAKKAQIRKMAAEKIDQSNDLVKLLNTYSQRAMAFTIRDQQMAEKKVRSKKKQRRRSNCKEIYAQLSLIVLLPFIPNVTGVQLPFLLLLSFLLSLGSFLHSFSHSFTFLLSFFAP
jgi:hypothetical protein